MAEDQEMYDDYISDAVVPKETRKLRACMICGLVKTWEQFSHDECENCKGFLEDARDFADSCTTTNFEGFISLMKPETSWVAKWQRTTTRVPGCYACVVHGRLNGHMISVLADNGIEYYPLDQIDQA